MLLCSKVQSPFSKPLAQLCLPGSSVAEQVTVNHLVAGSIPARAAILINELEKFGLSAEN